METHDADTLAGAARRRRLNRESRAGFELHVNAGEIRRLPLGFYALSGPVNRNSERAR